MPITPITNWAGVNEIWTVPAAATASEDNSKKSLADTELIFSYPEAPLRRYHFGGAALSFNTTPASPVEFLVKFGTRLVFQLQMSSVGPFLIPLVPPMVGGLGEPLEISVSAGGPGVRCRCNPNVWYLLGPLPY